MCFIEAKYFTTFIAESHIPDIPQSQKKSFRSKLPPYADYHTLGVEFRHFSPDGTSAVPERGTLWSSGMEIAL